MLYIRIIIGLLIFVTANGYEDFLKVSLNECFRGDSLLPCLKKNVIIYIDNKLGITNEERSVSNVDETLVSRFIEYMKGFKYSITLPLIDTSLQYNPYRSFDDFNVLVENNEYTKANSRGILKKKLLLPVLLLLKLKIKALMPIFVAIIGIKAIKALVLSKLALLVVVGFVAMQIFKKNGVMLPMGMAMEPAPVNYGAPPVLSTTSGYEPMNTWDSNGHYARVWSPSKIVDSQNLAYNYYTRSDSTLSGSPSFTSSSMSSSRV